jgi:predicted Fe-Mo cluster-binding NifX family protein
LDKIKIAVATKGYEGLEDTVSPVFGKTKTFTLVNLEDGEIRNVRIVGNPATAYEQGSGPIASKTLADLRVDLVIASQLGPGASELLEYHKITTMIVDPNSKVSEAVKKALSQIYKQPISLKKHCHQTKNTDTRRSLIGKTAIHDSIEGTN